MSFHEIVSQDCVDAWLSRKTQIAMIELLAVAVAFETFNDALSGSLVVSPIDAEAVEGAVIRGYSAKEDLCMLVGRLWESIADLDAMRACASSESAPTPTLRTAFPEGEQLRPSA